MTDIQVATRNPGKLTELQTILAVWDFRAAGQAVAVTESATDLAANAMAKAQAVWQPGRWVLGDDSGLFLAALPGQLGVQTARQLPVHGRNQALLALVANRSRAVTMRSVVVMLDETGRRYQASGVLHGTLAEAEHGVNSGGFDRLIIPNGAKVTLATLTTAAGLPYLPRYQAVQTIMAQMGRHTSLG